MLAKMAANKNRDILEAYTKMLNSLTLTWTIFHKMISAEQIDFENILNNL